MSEMSMEYDMYLCSVLQEVNKFDVVGINGKTTT